MLVRPGKGGLLHLIAHAGDDHALRRGLGGGGGLLRLKPAQAQQLVLGPGHRLGGGGAAIADGGVQLIQGAEAHLAQDIGQILLGSDGRQGDLHVLQLGLEGGPSGGDVLLPALLLEPLADLISGLVGLADLQPVPAGALGGFGGLHLYNVAVVQGIVKGDHPAVHPGSHHAVAHGGVDVIGKVDGGGPGGQALHVAVGGKDEHLVGEHIHLQGADELLRIGVLLALQQLAHPLELVLAAQLLVGQALLILPVGGHAVFRRLVHLPGADLHLEGDALPADDRGVEGLVHVGLGRADIVLKAAQHRLEHVVDAAQHVIAAGDVVHDDPEGVQVEDLVQGLVLGVHLPIDGVDVLYPAIDGGVDALLPQALLDLMLDARHKLLVGGGALGQLVLDLFIAHRVQIAQGQVLQLPLQLLHT